MSTAATTKFNTILAEAHVEAVKALTALLKTATDRTELRRLATTLVRIKRVDTESNPSRSNPRDRSPLPTGTEPQVAAQHEIPADVAPRPVPLALSSSRPGPTPRALTLAAASGLPGEIDPLTAYAHKDPSHALRKVSALPGELLTI